MRSYDATNYDPNLTYPLIPDGWHKFRISDFEDRQSASGYYMVIAKCKCLDPEVAEGIRENIEVWHFVTFMPVDKPGAGISLHFLKCISEPHEGKFDIDPFNWIGKTFMAKSVINEYVGKDGIKRRNNKLAEISPIPDTEIAKPSDDPFGD